MIIMLFFSCIPCHAKEAPKERELYAKSAVLMDAESGRILYAKNEDELLPMASTTKILTLIVVLERQNLDEIVTVSEYAASMPDVQLNIREGERYYLKDLLYSLMLESHNDSAVAIAEHTAGSIEAFSVLMNQKAKQIGCKQSFFITPNGLDATAVITDKNGKKTKAEHATTAKELAYIMSYCITKSPARSKFMEITGTDVYSFCDIEKKRQFQCHNHNAFLNMMEGAISGKTGFTSKAGYCYVGALKREERFFVVSLLACGWPGNKTYKWKDTRKLMTYGTKNYTFHPYDEIKAEQSIPSEVTVNRARGNRIGKEVKIHPVVREKMKRGKGILLKEEEEMEIHSDIEKNLQAPVTTETIIGSIKITIDSEVYKEFLIYPDMNVDKIDFPWCFYMVSKYFLLH